MIENYPLYSVSQQQQVLRDLNYDVQNLLDHPVLFKIGRPVRRFGSLNVQLFPIWTILPQFFQSLVVQTFLVSPFASRFYELGPLLPPYILKKEFFLALLRTELSFTAFLTKQIARADDEELTLLSTLEHPATQLLIDIARGEGFLKFKCPSFVLILYYLHLHVFLWCQKLGVWAGRSAHICRILGHLCTI